MMQPDPEKQLRSSAIHPEKVFAVLNPVAGTQEPAEVEQALLDVLQAQPLTFDLHITTPEDDLPAIVRQAREQGFRHFLVAGGDGTVAGVASGLVDTDLPLAIIPTGTSNALARLLEIPLGLQQAVTWWTKAPHSKVLDAMRVKDRYYFLNISLGLSSQALANVDRQEKQRYGSLVYLLKGLQGLFGISPFVFQLDVDGKTFTRRASEVVIANSGIQQFRAVRLDPEIRMDDGVVSVCHLRPRHLGDYLRIAASALIGRTPQAYGVTCRKARQRVGIRSRRQLPVQADGELIGHTPLEITVVPEAVRFLTPTDPQI